MLNDNAIVSTLTSDKFDESSSMTIVVKLDDLYAVRPSLYKIDGISLSDLFNIHKDDVDIFDGVFMSNLITLLCKNVVFNNNIKNLLLSIVEYETRIDLDIDIDLKTVLTYVRDMVDIVNGKLNDVDLSLIKLEYYHTNTSIIFYKSKSVMTLLIKDNKGIIWN